MEHIDIQAEVQARASAFALELTELIRQAAVAAVADALSAPASAQRRAPRSTARVSTRGTRRTATAPSSAKGKGKRIRRSEKQLTDLGNLVVAHLKKNPGDRLEEIGRGLGMPTAQLKRPITILLQAKKLRTSGRKRGTKYFLGRASGAKKRS